MAGLLTIFRASTRSTLPILSRVILLSLKTLRSSGETGGFWVEKNGKGIKPSLAEWMAPKNVQTLNLLFCV